MDRETWKLTIPYVKQTANGNLLHDSGNSSRGSVTIQKGGMGRETGGRGHGCTYGQFLLMLIENHKIL